MADHYLIRLQASCAPDSLMVFESLQIRWWRGSQRSQLAQWVDADRRVGCCGSTGSRVCRRCAAGVRLFGRSWRCDAILLVSSGVVLVVHKPGISGRYIGECYRVVYEEY